MNDWDDRERRADEELARLWHGLPTPTEGELHALAHTASSEPRDTRPPERRRVRPRRWALAVVGAALLAASGLGFGLGTSLTPSGSAGRNVVGFGFLPGRGWDVIQTGGANPGTTRAVASKDGVVISVTSTPRGDPAEDVGFDLQDLPLQVGDARPIGGDPSRLELRAGVGGYNVDATISFADARPTAAMLASAQQQLNRLVVAADRVTIGVRPAISSPLVTHVTVFGTIDSGRAGESITIQARDCGTTFFRVFAGANSEQGGTWSTFIFPRITTRLRAVWNGETSAEVVFRQRVFVGLRQRSASRFLVSVGARFSGKPVTIQRFDPRVGQWETVKRVRLGEDFHTYFTLRVPKGTRIRAVFPDSLARPCYLGATSPIIRT